MIQETVKSERVSPLAGLFLVLGVIIGIYIIQFFVAWLRLAFGFEHGIWIVIGVAALVVAWILNRTKGYRYTLHQGRLIMERLIGGHGKLAVNVLLTDVRAIGTEQEIKARYSAIKGIKRLVLSRESKPTWGLVYTDKGQENMVLFQPSEKLVQQIRNTMGFPKDIV